MLIDREQEKSDKTRNITTGTTMSIIVSHLIYYQYQLKEQTKLSMQISDTQILWAVDY